MDARAITWANRFVWGLVLSTAALAVAGIAAMFLDLPAEWVGRLEAVCVIALACVAGFALGVANSAAAAMRSLAGDKETIAAFWLALVVAGLTGLVSLVGVHIGWAVLTDAPQQLPSWEAVDAAGLGLAFVKPAMSYVIAACRDKELQERARAEAAERARLDAIAADERARRHAEQMRRIELEAAYKTAQAEPERKGVDTRIDTPSPRSNSPRKHLSVVEKLAAGAAAATVLAAGMSPAEASSTSYQTEPAPRAQRSDTVTAEDRALARSLIAQGVAPLEVHKRTGVPHGTCKRQAAEFKAGRWAA